MWTPNSAAEIARVQSAVRDSSRVKIVDILQNGISSNLNSNKWIPNSNKYLKDTINKIKNDHPGSLNQSQVSEYVAASSILHCSDGWDYLGSAISAMINGNYSNVVHLGYYAELRAVMSFLASDGIGIFSNKHVFIDAAGGVHNAAQHTGTHNFAWYALREWADVVAKSDTIFKTIVVGGRSINDWILATGRLTGTPLVAQLSKTWLSRWSLDLTVLSEDHTYRNEVSYRPQGIKTDSIYNPDQEKELKLLMELWSICEPSGGTKFRVLDYLLLREALFYSYTARYGKRPTPAQFERYVNGAAINLGITLDVHMGTLLKKTTVVHDYDFFGIADLLGVSPRESVIRPLSIITRSFLLLRVATASVQDNLTAASISQSDINFWIDNVGQKLGYWQAGSMPTSTQDLWTDIDDALSDLEAWKTTQTSIEKQTLIRDETIAMVTLQQWQRANLWAML